MGRFDNIKKKKIHVKKTLFTCLLDPKMIFFGDRFSMINLNVLEY